MRAVGVKRFGKSALTPAPACAGEGKGEITSNPYFENPAASLPMNSAAQSTILSPCVGLCELDRDGYCIGCLRTIDEITRWRLMTDDERRRLVYHTLPERGAKRA